MNTAILILSAVILLIVLVLCALLLRTYAIAHVLASRTSEDPAKVQESLSRTIDQRISSMEENLSRVENFAQHQTQSFVQCE